MHPLISETGFTAIDIETTGLKPSFCGIVEIGATRIFPDGSTQNFQTLVDPGCCIPREVVAIHGITDSMVCGQPCAAEAVRSLVEFAGASPLVLHNAPFDMGFLNPLVRGQNIRWGSSVMFDTLPLSRLAFPGMASYSLKNLSRFFDFDSGTHHRALADCRYCALLFMRILNKLAAPEMTFDSFAEKYASTERHLAR